jgi:hypothetical protein
MVSKRKVPGVDSRKTKPKTVQTMESLLNRTVEEGDCLLWTGYVGNMVPQVSHGGNVVAVRRLMLKLLGKELRPGDHASTKCRNPLCVHPDHISHRNKQQHAAAMSKSSNRNDFMRAAKVAASKRKNSKLTMEQAREIRMSQESGPVLAARFGINKEWVNRIKRGDAWREYGGSPFAGLGAR